MISRLRERITSIAKREDGFTLIELMIVIAVLGILAGIAIPKFSGVQDKAEIAAAKSELKSIQTGLEMYYAENNEYPTTSLSAISEYVQIDNIDNYGVDTLKSDEYIIKSKSMGGYTVTLTTGGIDTSE
jgi:general secretion pathway protein G